MNLFVDTSVWSLAMRRDRPSDDALVERLRAALTGGEAVFTTGLVLQELLQGFRGPAAREALLQRFGTLPLVMPDRLDHVAAADVRNRCRRTGVQVGTVDALLAQLCLRHDLVMLSADGDFRHLAEVVDLSLWSG